MQSLIFFGADQYSAVALQHILEHWNTGKPASRQGGLENLTVVTDKHEGGSPVEKLAKEHDLAVSYYPTTPEEKIIFIKLLTSHFSLSTSPIGLCASFDHLIPKDVIAQFGGNLYNLHPSLLPQYRNVSPVQYSIALGDKETGITLFRISPGIDDGEIIAQATEPILESDTTASLTPRLFKKGAELFLDSVKNGFKAKQDNGFTKPVNLIFTKRLKKDSGYIEWPVLSKLLAGKKIEATETNNELLTLRLNKITSSGLIIDNWVLIISDLLRSLTPWPGIWSLVPTKKGELRISLESVTRDITLKLAGKPKAISMSDFTKYYL